MKRSDIKAGESAIPALVAAREMPPLSHWPGKPHGKPFDPSQSQVLEYLCGHPYIRRWVMTTMRRSGAIVYDHKIRKWRGKDTR